MSEDDERTDGTPEDESTAAPEPEQVEAEPIDPKEAFVQGMGLLFHAARGALGGLKKEIEKADIPQGLRSAAEEMKRAADAAIKGEPRENEPEWVQPKGGARIATDDEPEAEPEPKPDEPESDEDEGKG
ncbi:MAG: hypothetical protein JRI23_17395 [Deltaproteobacteria bacterium]|jgi:hypothetical protein|nr:hypothetical protein [Deltaproteobacteria bacterium]MBW2533596.1 hypothetical protein [Deltaproteobacteria bacterium]